MCTLFTWLSTETSLGLLYMWQRNFLLHKVWIISGIAKDLSSTYEGLCSVELVINDGAEHGSTLLTR
jgi:hypothetical protein